MKFCRIIIGIIVASTFLFGCSQTNIETQNNNQAVNDSSGNDIETTKPINETDTQPKTEAEYFPTDNTKYKRIGNARFNFWIDIPNGWKAFDISANGDGYMIETENPDIDIRAYGGLNANDLQNYTGDLTIDSSTVSDFTFRNSVVGKQVVKPDAEITFTCSFSDRHINFYVNYEKDKNWFNENKDTILYIAKSLRSGDENADRNRVITDNKNRDIISEITEKKDLNKMAEEDIDDDGYIEIVVEFQYKLYLVRDNNGKREFIGELEDYISVVHEIDSVEIKQLDNKSKKKYIIAYAVQYANGGTGYTIYSLDNNEISFVDSNFYGATAKGHSSLEDIDMDGNIDSVLRVKHYDQQQHFLVYYKNWDGSGETQHKIEYGNDDGKFIYPSTPEKVIQNYIEDFYWKEYLGEEMDLLTGGRKLDIPYFNDNFSSQSLEYSHLHLEYKAILDTPKEKVFMVKNDDFRSEYYFTTQLDKNWVITAISMNKP